MGAEPSIVGIADVDARACRFDWYAATVMANPVTVLGALCESLELTAKPLGRGYQGYAEQYELRNSRGVVARAASGGCNPGLHAWASGDSSPAFAAALRAVYPSHRVTRVDSAIDFNAPGIWDLMFGTVHAFADVPDAFGRRLKVETAGDWTRCEDGRTFYVGSRKSPAFVRLYEKGVQVAGTLAADPDAAAEVSRDWVRLELELKPVKGAKAVVASLSPAQVWGVSAWTTGLVNSALSLGVDPVEMEAPAKSDDERAWDYMLIQYGPLLRRLAAAGGGDWASLGLQIGMELEGRRHGRGGSSVYKGGLRPGAASILMEGAF